MRAFPLLLLVILGLLTTWLWGCSRGSTAIQAGGTVEIAAAPKSSTVFGEVPEFRLFDQRGRTITRADLLGQPWVMAAIFTRCTGPCPAISRRMADLERRLKGTDVMFVSVSVDPEHDTSAVLNDYAASLGADPKRWLFLTGPKKDIVHLVRAGFWMAISRASEGTVPVGQAVTHDTRLVAVDRTGKLRGWYDQDQPEMVGRLLQRMRFLASENSTHGGSENASSKQAEDSR